MYTWIWRRLPGGVPVKTLEALLLVAVACVVLLFVVFPWLEPLLPFTEVTVGP